MLFRSILISWFLVVALQANAEQITSSADELMQRVQQAFYYSGNNQRTLVKMQLINRQGQIRSRELTYLRLNDSADQQRYYMYFHAPSDIKDTSFLIWKYPDKDDDRWLYIPAIKLVKRIAADDRASSFVGSDFTYEDVSGRDMADERHHLLREDTLNGRPVYVVESHPKTVIDYTRRLSWIDKERYLPLKEEFYDVQDNLARVFTADIVEQIDSIWTVTKRTMKNLISNHKTEVLYTNVEYNIDITKALFTERSLRTPPRQWIY